MIGKLFGSKTRVKLLHLFLNNPGKAFYVREITRLINEQINSVRRELANMTKVGIIVSDSVDNKLYYEVDKKYQHYGPLREIFADSTIKSKPAEVSHSSWHDEVRKLPGLKLAIVAGVLVSGSVSQVDLLLVGKVPKGRVEVLIKKIEKIEGRKINYSILSYGDFYYRLSVKDRFVMEIIEKSSILVDTERILSKNNEGGE